MLLLQEPEVTPIIYLHCRRLQEELMHDVADVAVYIGPRTHALTRATHVKARGPAAVQLRIAAITREVLATFRE